jgi:peptidoglycan hydrolase CwlO-like protein
MISELYLKRALNIRKDYIQIITDIQKYEKIAKELSDSLGDRMGDLKSLLQQINDGKIQDMGTAKEKLNDIMINTELNINNVDGKISVLNNQMDKLREDEKTLHFEMKQTYPQLSDDDMKKELGEYLTKMKVI